MKEVINFSVPAKSLTLPAEIAERFEALSTQIVSRSTFLWGEHCTECGFPDCYSSCSFYTPRQDYHCRRFENGLQTAKAGARALTSVTFKMWGKMEAEGPVSILTRANADQREAAHARKSTLIDKLPVSQAIRNKLAWRVNTRAQAGGTDTGIPPSAFIIEAYMPTEAPVAFTLSFMPNSKDNPNFFQMGFELTSGYNLIEVPVAQISERVNLAESYRIQIEPITESGTGEIIFGLVDFATLEKHVAKVPAPLSATSGEFASKVKCVVWDLDHTVWDGTLAEDGIEGLTIKPEVVTMMHKLDARGILNSIASKNDEEIGLKALEHFGLRDLVLYPQIGWHPKSQSLKTIASSIDIGLDTFVFLDDQKFERAEVSENLTMVECLDALEAAGLLGRERFDVPATDEAAKRRQKYKDEEKRVSTFVESGQEYLSFLKGCEIKLKLLPLTDERLDRAFELSQRTNQLNFSGQRYERQQLIAMQAAPEDYDVTLLQCEDRFGDYGIIGLSVLNRKTATLESFMMSCRVQRKMVEHAYFGSLLKHLKASGTPALHVKFRKTERNDASVRMLEDLGFEATHEDGDTIGFHKSTESILENQGVVSIEDKRPVEAKEVAAT